MEAKIKVIRDSFTKKSTVGKLYINDVFICHTLEDVVRKHGEKVMGKTAIPYGTYDVILTMSNRFKRVTPLIYNKPDKITLAANGISFAGIRIHGGNTSENTEGCILVAYKRLSKDMIQGTAEADITKELKKYSKITIEIDKI